MTDRELLELAAKAVGINGVYGFASDDFYYQGNTEGILTTLPNGQSYVWNPITDDGDALRLAVSLGLVVDCSRPSAGEPYKQHAIWRDELCDTETLTRRAIVQAAAEIGKGMK